MDVYQGLHAQSRIAQMHNVTQMETRRVLENSRWKDANGTQERVAKVKNQIVQEFRDKFMVNRQSRNQNTGISSKARLFFSQTPIVSAAERMWHWG